jgi:hypothetical protein
MDKRRAGLIVAGLAIFALVDGFVLGLFSSLWSQGPSPAEAAQLSVDDYVWMVSASYANDGDLSNAQRRLQMVQSDDALTTQIVGETAQRTSLRAETVRTLPLLQLARAMGIDPLEMAANGADEGGASQAFLVTASVDEPVADPGSRSALVAAPTVRHGSAFLAPAMATASPTRAPTKVPTKKPTSAPVTAKLEVKPTSKPAAAAPVVALSVARANPQPAALSAPAGVNFAVASVRRLTACENGGNHHLFILVEDTQGNGLPGLPVEVVWPSGSTIVNTGTKVENLPPLGINAQNTAGYVNFAMYHGSYQVRVLNGVSQQTDWLTVDIPHDEYCAANDNPQGNSTFHYSYLIVFKKVR